MLRPVADNVLIEIDPVEVSQGGIVLVQSVKHKDRAERHTKATVLLAGPGTPDHAVDVVPGDRVVCAELAGDNMPIKYVPNPKAGMVYRMVREEELLGVLCDP